jgi:hypothetical protein
MSTKKNSINYISRDELFLIRKEKLKREIESAKRILEKKIEPIEIADNFFHNIIKIAEDKLLQNNPHLSQKEIFHKIKETFDFADKLKRKKF